MGLVFNETAEESRVPSTALLAPSTALPMLTDAFAATSDTMITLTLMITNGC